MRKQTFFNLLVLTLLLLGVVKVFGDDQTLLTQETPAPIKKARTFYRERVQFFWQPLESFSAFTLASQGTYFQYSTFTTGGFLSSTTAQTGTEYSLTYSYGLSQNWAATMNISTTPLRILTTLADGSQATTSTAGPNSLGLSLRNTTPLNRWRLYYGLLLSFNLDVNIPAQANDPGNNFPGGDNYTPYIGTAYNVFGRSFAGARLEVAYNAPRNVDPNRTATVDTVHTGQNARQKQGGSTSNFTAFFERHLPWWIFDMRGSATYTSSSSTTQLESQTDTESYLSFGQGIGIQYFLTKQFIARLDADISEIPQINRSTTVQTGYNILSAALTLRDEF